MLSRVQSYVTFGLICLLVLAIYFKIVKFKEAGTFSANTKVNCETTSELQRLAVLKY